MKNFSTGVSCFSIVSLFVVSFVFLSCNSRNYDPSLYLTDNYIPNQTNATIFLDVFPSDIYLELGKSVFIVNGESAFTFIDVLENSESNSLVLLQVEYDNGISKTIELNTKSSPQTYSLENEHYFYIHLKELNFIRNTYELAFTYNKNGCYW